MNVEKRHPPIRLDRSRQVAPQIEEVLRDRILSLELTPNTVVSRAGLQTEFGVSQTPVRDALMKLSQEGLIEIYPQHATIVSRIDVQAARQAHFLRTAIEAEAVHRIASRANERIVVDLRKLLSDQRIHSAPEEHEEFARLDRDFHRLLYDSAGVPDLWTLVRRHSGHIDRLRRLNLPLPGKIESVLQDHARLVERLAEGDPDGAAAALRRHLSGTLSMIGEIRERNPDYLAGE